MTRERIAWLAAAVCAAAAAFLYVAGRPAPAPAATLARLTFDSGVATWPALSPDGRLVAYASDRADGRNLDLYIQPVLGGEPRRLTETPVDESEPAFSPDAGTLAYRAEENEKNEAGIWLVPTSGGSPRFLAPAGHNPRYSPDGQWIAYWTPIANRAFLIPTSGGAARPIHPELSIVRSPTWSPDGRSLLFIDSKNAWIAPAFTTASAVAVPALPPADDLNWTPAGFFYSARAGWTRNIYFCPADAAGRPTAAPSLVTNGTESADRVAASRSGRIVFESGSERFNLWALPIDAATGQVTGALTRLTDSFRPAQELHAGPAPSGALTYSILDREHSRAIRAVGRNGKEILVYDSDTPRRSLYGVNPKAQRFTVERDRIVMILAEKTSNIWLADVH